MTHSLAGCMVQLVMTAELARDVILVKGGTMVTVDNHAYP